MKYRADIDGLRTLAVVPVVLFHAGVAGFSGGFVGVDIFFVISGYLITTIINHELGAGHFSIAKFYERRARRILPALFAVLILSVVAGWFLLVPEDYEGMGKSILSALFFFSNIWFWQNSGGYFDGATDYLPMLHTWSLAVEEQFYIFFPLLLMALHRIGRRLVLPAALAVVAFSFLLALWATPKFPSASFYLLPTRIWELGFGSLLALGIVPWQMSRSVREALAALGLLAIVVPVFAYDNNITFPGLAAVPPVLGATLIIWAGSCGSSMVGRLLALRPVVFIGMLSYSLYLWHWPIMAFARNRLFSVGLPHIWQAGAVIASFAAAWMSWRFVEQPFRKPERVGGLSRGQIFAGSILGMASLGLLVGTVVMTTGAASQRFSGEQLGKIKDVAKRFPEGHKCFGTRPVDKLCIFGKTTELAASDWLVWGDSHAESMLPPLIDFAEANDHRVIFAAKGNCPPLLGVMRTDMPLVENEKCEYFSQKVFERIVSDSGIKTVFLIARWPLYAEGKGMPSEGKSRFRLSYVSKDVGDKENLEVLRETLARQVSRFTDQGKKVVILEAVPELPWDVPARIKSEILFNIPFNDDRFTLAQVQLRQSRTNGALETLRAIPGVTVINLAEAFCTPLCPVRDDIRAYYWDNNHLSVLGAGSLAAPILAKKLEEVRTENLIPQVPEEISR